MTENFSNSRMELAVGDSHRESRLSRSGNSSARNRIALIISSYQPTQSASALLRVAIESALSQKGPDVEIWVVDGGSSPGPYLVMGSDYPTVNFLVRKRIPPPAESKIFTRDWVSQGSQRFQGAAPLGFLRQRVGAQLGHPGGTSNHPRSP